ncbi:MAG: DUF1849 family protein [Aestuariivirga sp.]
MKMKTLALIILAAPMVWVTPTIAQTLAAHRAFYALEATKLDAGSGYSSIDGKLAYELTGNVCDGYSVSFRIVNNYVQTEKSPQLIDTQLATWESGDGLEMNFRQKQYLNSNLQSEQKLDVKRSKTGSEAKGVMTAPKDLEYTVPGEAVFPSTHLLRLIGDAEKGLNHDVSLVYDGSDDDKTFKAVTFIGKKREPGSFAPDASNPETAALKGLASWPMSVSYYSLEKDASDTPVYQSSFNVYENGIATELMLDYGSYALKGHLTKLELLKSGTCNKPAN